MKRRKNGETEEEDDLEKPLIERQEHEEEEPPSSSSRETGGIAKVDSDAEGALKAQVTRSHPRIHSIIAAPKIHRPIAPPIVPPLTTPIVAHGPGHSAAVITAVTAPLLQKNEGRSSSAPRERRAVKLPANDDLLRQEQRRQRRQQSQQQDHVAIEVLREERGQAIPRARTTNGSKVSSIEGRSPSKNPSFDNLITDCPSDTSSGRIAVYCVAEKFDQEILLRTCSARRARLCDGVAMYDQSEMEGDNLEWEGEVLAFACKSLWTSMHVGECMFFDFGVAVFWGLQKDQEWAILKNVVQTASIEPLRPEDVEDEEFKFQYVSGERPRIQNDTIIMGIHLMKNSIIKLAIAFPLAQSTKLKIYESRIQREFADRFIEIPKSLARSGSVDLTKREIHQLIGKVFLEKCAVNLLTTVLDTPDFFWDASDALCALYENIFEYLEINDRVEILNARFEILEAMLDMLRDQNESEHSVFLEWIVIILIVVEVVIGLVEILGLCGILPHSRDR